MRFCPNRTCRVTYHCPSYSLSLAALACSQFSVSGLLSLLFALLGCFSLGSSQKCFFLIFWLQCHCLQEVTTSPSPASPTPVSLSHTLFSYVYSTCHCPKSPFYSFVYSLMTSLPTLEHKHHEGRIWAGLSTTAVSGSRGVPGCREGVTGSQKLSNWPEVTSLHIRSRMEIRSQEF